MRPAFLRPAAALALLLALGACATPLQRCIQQAERDIRPLEQEIAERRANVARGFRIERQVVPQFVPLTCRRHPTGEFYPCFDWVDTVHDTPRPINVAIERERIAHLESIVARERAAAAPAIAACRAQFPEG